MDARRHRKLLLRAREVVSDYQWASDQPISEGRCFVVEILYKRVAGLDVHKRTVVATRMFREQRGGESDANPT